MALVMVVLMLALMLTLMLAVYSMSGSELKGAHRYASGQQVRRFGDLAVDVAIAQLRKACACVASARRPSPSPRPTHAACLSAPTADAP